MRGSLAYGLLVTIGIAICCAPARAHDKTCQDPPAPPRDTQWRQLPGAHPLVGEVLEGDRPITIEAGPCQRTPLQHLSAELWAALAHGGIVLLGEVHDNPEHHLLRADILRWAPRTGGSGPLPRPAAVFEHLRPNHQPVLDGIFRQQLRSDHKFTATDLLDQLRWKESGWPAAEMFQPLFEAVLDQGLVITAGDDDPARIRALAKGDKSSLGAARLDLLKIAEAMPRVDVEALSVEIAESHCGVLPAAAVPAMSLAQQYRDAHLAQALVTAAERQGSAILLAGNGHVRSDRAVPWYVRQMAPRRNVVAVTLIEVREGMNDAKAYLSRDALGKVASTYVIFTPRKERPDPCAAMRERFKPSSK